MKYHFYFLFTYVVCELYNNHDVYLHQDICELTSSIYIPRGINVTSLNHDQTWPFQPSKLFKVSTCNLKSCCQIYSFMSYSNPALLLALFFLLLLFSHHICIFFLLLPLKSFQSTFLFRKWKEGKGKWKRVSLSSDVLFPF